MKDREDEKAAAAAWLKVKTLKEMKKMGF